MRYLLDTHTMIWYCEGSDRLGVKAREITNSADTNISVSMVSLWEFSIKYSLEKLKFEGGLLRLCELIKQADFILLPITQSYLACMIELPFIHRDPFDRLLIATAKVDDMTIVTTDENINKYDVSSVW